MDQTAACTLLLNAALWTSVLQTKLLKSSVEVSHHTSVHFHEEKKTSSFSESFLVWYKRTLAEV